MKSTGSPWACVLAGVALLTCAAARAAECTIGEHTFTVPDGFVIERVAGPPLVERPIAADFDELGRLYVADSSGSNDKVEKQLEDKPHRIVRLEDTDGDGGFDRSVVFADRMMFPEGAMWLDGSLYVAAPPSIWKLTDRDGDGKAEEREEWFKGGTLTGCANDLHGPYRGPDGWIYWCKGAFAEQTHERPGREPIKDRAAHIFRCRPDGSGLEVVMSGGMDNPVEIAFTSTGEPIFTSTFIDLSGPGKRDGLGHAVLGGVFPKVNDVTEEVKRTGPLLPPMTHFGPGAPSGFCSYVSEGFGNDFRGNLFATLFNLHKVTRHVLEPTGSTFRTHDSDFVVSSNADFHPTDVLEDADGSLLIVDTGGWYKLCCPTSQLAKPDVLGAIYRVRKTGASPIDDPRGKRLDWSKMQVTELVQLLSDSRPAVVQRAADQLSKPGPEAVLSLKALCSSAISTDVIRQALWILTRINTPEAREVIRTVLHHADPVVQQTAARAAGVVQDRESVPLLGSLATEARGAMAAFIRRSAVESIGRIRDSRGVSALLDAAATAGDDRFLEHAITYALIEIGDSQTTRRGFSTDQPAATRRVALIALNEMNGRPLAATEAAELLGSQDEKLREAATWVLGRRSDAGPALASYLPGKLSAPGITSSDAGQIETLLLRSIQVPEIRRLGAEILQDGSTAARRIVMRTVAKARPKEVPPEWITGLAVLLENSSSDLLSESISVARALAGKKEFSAQIVPALGRLAQAEKLQAEIRLAALAAIPQVSFGGPNASMFVFLCRQLQDSPSVASRTSAAEVIARAKLSDYQREELVNVLSRLGSAELTKLLPVFSGGISEPLARRVIVVLLDAPAFASLPPQVVRAALAKFPAALQVESDRLLSRLNVDIAAQRARLDDLAARLPKGDVRRGQGVFNSAKGTCSVCHAMGSLGGTLGPDLTVIGTIRSERDLLEAIVFPSASFVRSYEPAIVRLKNGEEVVGILKGEASDTVRLALGPGSERRFERSEVESVQPGTASLMPQGYDQILSREELADLLAFLKATKWGAQ